MARRSRCSDAGYLDHVLNLVAGRASLFAKPADSAAFEKVLRQEGGHYDTVCRYVERNPLRAETCGEF